MIKRLKNLINEYRENNNKNSQLLNTLKIQSLELEWAHIYHDSIRGIPFINDLSLNIGRWAGNYPFFYVLNRILNDYKPRMIIEMGLGESSKMITTYLKNSLTQSEHLIIEHNSEWIDYFKNNFRLADNSSIQICPIEEITINNKKSLSYKNLEVTKNNLVDLYVVDGPFGSDHFSRYNIIELIKSRSIEDEFVIIMDDTNRVGEKETLKVIHEIMKNKGFEFYLEDYIGQKSLTVLATKKYRFATSF
jgi:hypothetical protein